MSVDRFSERWGRILSAAVYYLLVAGFPLTLAYLMFRFRVNVPFMDEWSMVPLLEKSLDGTLSFQDLIAQHIEHRPFLSRVIILGLARVTDWNISYELAVNFAISAATFFVLVLYLVRTRRAFGKPLDARLLILLTSLFVFSLAAWENWLWGWQIQVFLSVFAVVAGIYLLTGLEHSWLRFSLAVLCGLAATFSFGNGLVFWAVGFFVLLVSRDAAGPRRNTALAAWVLASAAALALYFFRWGVSDHHPLSIASARLQEGPLALLGEYARYVLVFLGGPVRPEGQLAVGALGLLVFLAAARFLAANRFVRLETLSPYLALGLYSIGSALMIGIGRAPFGHLQASHSRYVTIAYPFWIAIAVLLYLVLETTRGQRGLPVGRGRVVESIRIRFRAAGDGGSEIGHRDLGVEWVMQVLPAVLLVLIGALTIHTSLGSIPSFQAHHERLSAAQYEPWVQEQNWLLRMLYPEREVLEAFSVVLARHRLSIFSEPFAAGFTDLSVEAAIAAAPDALAAETLALAGPAPVYSQAPGSAVEWDIRLPAAQILSDGPIVLRTGIVFERLPAPGERVTYRVELYADGVLAQRFEVDIFRDAAGNMLWGPGLSVREACPGHFAEAGGPDISRQDSYAGPFFLTYAGEETTCRVTGPYAGDLPFPAGGILPVDLDLSGAAGASWRVRFEVLVRGGERERVLWLAPEVLLPEVIR